MIPAAAYFELTDLMGRYAHYISTGAYERLSELFAVDAQMEFPQCPTGQGQICPEAYFAGLAAAARVRNSPEFFSVFGQLSEIRNDGLEARCLWMYLSIVPDPESGRTEHQIGRIDQLCVRENGTFKIKTHRQFLRTRLEPVPCQMQARADLHIPEWPAKNPFSPSDSDQKIGDELEILNIHSRYEQYLHCGNWDGIAEQFSHAADVSWTVGNTRKRFLTEHPEYIGEMDGPGNSDEPPYWMGAKVGYDRVMQEGFRGMVIPFSPENQGLYCCSDMLLPLVVHNPDTGLAYTSVPSYGGFIVGPAAGGKSPYPVLNSIGRWLIEWRREDGQWKMYHFCWSTFYELAIDTYDPAPQLDWLSTHTDIHDWPALPEPYAD